MRGLTLRQVGNKIYAVCHNCGQIVRINKPIFGSLHICSTPEEQRDYAKHIQKIAEAAESALQEMK